MTLSLPSLSSPHVDTSQLEGTLSTVVRSASRLTTEDQGAYVTACAVCLCVRVCTYVRIYVRTCCEVHLRSVAFEGK